MWELKELFDPDYVLNPGERWQRRVAAPPPAVRPACCAHPPGSSAECPTQSLFQILSPPPFCCEQPASPPGVASRPCSLNPTPPPPPTTLRRHPEQGPAHPREEPEALARRQPAGQPLHRVRLLRVKLPLQVGAVPGPPRPVRPGAGLGLDLGASLAQRGDRRLGLAASATSQGHHADPPPAHRRVQGALPAAFHGEPHARAAGGSRGGLGNCWTRWRPTPSSSTPSEQHSACASSCRRG